MLSEHILARHHVILVNTVTCVRSVAACHYLKLWPFYVTKMNVHTCSRCLLHAFYGLARSLFHYSSIRCVSLSDVRCRQHPSLLLPIFTCRSHSSRLLYRLPWQSNDADSLVITGLMYGRLLSCAFSAHRFERLIGRDGARQRHIFKTRIQKTWISKVTKDRSHEKPSDILVHVENIEKHPVTAAETVSRRSDFSVNAHIIKHPRLNIHDLRKEAF